MCEMKELLLTHVVQSSRSETKNSLKESGMTRFRHTVGPLLRVLTLTRPTQSIPKILTAYNV